MRPEGQVTLCCDRRGKIHTIDFLMVNVPNQKLPLLSGRDAQALDYLKTPYVKLLFGKWRSMLSSFGTPKAV